MSLVFAGLTFVAVLLTGWQWACGLRFRVHARSSASRRGLPVTLLKPIRGWDEQSATCLRSWLEQDYPEPVQVLFGIDEDDLEAEVGVRELIAHLPEERAKVVLCQLNIGPHPKVAKLVQLGPHALHDIVLISDADVWAPPDLLAQIAPLLGDPAVGLVNCFYCQPDAPTFAMHWMRIATNSDFWTQVLQSNSLKPQDFALGAVMAVRRRELDAIGGFSSYLEYLADDYQLGQRIAGLGLRIELATVVVECRFPPMSGLQVWAHQLRQARSIRVCQPVPYFFSLLNNVTLWCLLWLFTNPTFAVLAGTGLALLIRVATALHAEFRLCRSRAGWASFHLIPIKDLLQFVVWAASFLGNRITWRGNRFRLRPGGKLEWVGEGSTPRKRGSSASGKGVVGG
jgi:ceramide glucosyltransferase